MTESSAFYGDMSKTEGQYKRKTKRQGFCPEV